MGDGSGMDCPRCRHTRKIVTAWCCSAILPLIDPGWPIPSILRPKISWFRRNPGDATVTTSNAVNMIASVVATRGSISRCGNHSLTVVDSSLVRSGPAHAAVVAAAAYSRSLSTRSSVADDQSARPDGGHSRADQCRHVRAFLVWCSSSSADMNGGVAASACG